MQVHTIRVAGLALAIFCGSMGASIAQTSTTERAVVLLALEEQYRSCPYDDFFPHRKLDPGDLVAGTLTVGYGQTGPELAIGDCITQPDALVLLRNQIKAVIGQVDAAVQRPMTEEQKLGWISFFYNVGPRAAKSSAIFLFNQGRDAEACESLQRWNKSKGRVLRGLSHRRAREAKRIDPDCRILHWDEEKGP